jgi:uncharacterized phage-like protein YoqJ
MDTIDKEHACAFTGHRPERLGIPDSKVIAWLDAEIGKAVEAGYTQFITGMQRGVDLWAAEAVIKLRKEGKPIRLIAASAFRGMENQWDRSWQTRYRRVLYAADEAHFISDRPGRTAFFRRNSWMVDHASRLIAVYTGAPGGTKETIRYAKTQGLTVICIADQGKENN